MVKSTEKKILTGLEIGHSKVAVLVGELLPDGMINIIGVGNYPSRGMDRDGVNDLESIIKCVQLAVNQAELMSNYDISSVYLSLSGKHISCQNEIGMVPISAEEVTQEDIENVVHTARSVRVKNEHRILHVIPQEYTIDYQEGIKNPIGLSGIRMQAKVHLITCHNDMARNIIKSVERCKLKVKQLIFSGLASSYAVLTEDERNLGVCVIDIGSGTMDVVIYTSGSLRYTKVIPYAGSIVTQDIAYALKTSYSDAEIIKIKHGCTSLSCINEDEIIEILSIDRKIKKNLKKQILVKVIELRYKELLQLVNQEILKLQENLKSQNIKYNISAGIVLTGGASQIEGLVECAQQVFGMPVRIGLPLNITGLINYAQEHHYSTTVGLLQYGKELYLNEEIEIKKRTFIGTILKNFSGWLKREF